jgi:cytochrome d ubiquinol oxidase subunit I
VWTSLSVLTAVYGVLAVVEIGLISRFVRRGITSGDGAPTPTGTADVPESPDGAADDVLSFAY